MKKLLAILMSLIGIIFVSQNHFNPFFTLVLFLLYGILRWKVAEAEILHVSNKMTMNTIRVFIVVFGLLIFSGAGAFGAVVAETTAWFGAIVALLGLILAYEVIRLRKKVKIKIEDNPL